MSSFQYLAWVACPDLGTTVRLWEHAKFCRAFPFITSMIISWEVNISLSRSKLDSENATIVLIDFSLLQNLIQFIFQRRIWSYLADVKTPQYRSHMREFRYLVV